MAVSDTLHDGATVEDVDRVARLIQKRISGIDTPVSLDTIKAVLYTMPTCQHCHRFLDFSGICWYHNV